MLLLDFTDFLACVERVVWDGVTRGESRLQECSVGSGALGAARVLTYLSCWSAVGDAPCYSKQVTLVSLVSAGRRDSVHVNRLDA